MKIGDVVTLNSGGPHMTVKSVLSDGCVSVTWWDDGIRNYEFHVDMLTKVNASEPVTYIGKKDVTRLCGFSMSTLERYLNKDHVNYDPTFPKPVQRMGKSRMLFVRDDVIKWYNNQKP